MMPRPRWLSLSLSGITVTLFVLMGLDGFRVALARCLLLLCLGLNTVGLLDALRKGNN